MNRLRRKTSVAPLPLAEAIQVNEAEVQAVLAELYTEARDVVPINVQLVAPTIQAREVLLLGNAQVVASDGRNNESRPNTR